MTPVQAAMARGREIAHVVKLDLCLPSCGPEGHDWPCDALASSVAAVVVSMSEAHSVSGLGYLAAFGVRSVPPYVSVDGLKP